MEIEFDKEIDALLRQTAQSESVSANPKFKIQNPKSPHLDADEISAFGENALPEKTKTLYLRHLADCERCRKILSNVVASNSETQIETAAPENDKIKIAAVAVPWYKKLFAAPNLAYAMGALVLVFAGLIAFTFLRNAPRDAEVSQVINEKPTNMGGAGSDGETVTTESSAPTASMSNAASTSNTAMANTMQSNQPTARGGLMSNGSMSNGASASNNSTAAQNESAKAKTPTQTNTATEQKALPENQMNGASFADRKKETTNRNQARAADNDEAKNNEVKPAPKPAAPPVASADASSTRSAGALSSVAPSKNARGAETDKAETRKVGDKNFRRTDGVWYDAAYNGQSTTNISRGSNEFKKLDAGLRSIAETLSGTIVVLWKSKWYRIQ